LCGFALFLDRVCSASQPQWPCGVKIGTFIVTFDGVFEVDYYSNAV